MIRRFNYTGRRKIPRSLIRISLMANKNGKYFKAELNFDDLGFPGEAKVYVDANFKGVYQRFYYGTIHQISEPGTTNLTELPDTEVVYFDVSIVDESGKIGLLLGNATGITTVTNGQFSERIPLLPVNPADLGNQFWKLTFDSSGEGHPVLEINRNIPHVFEIAQNDYKFISLVYPAAFRQILIKLLQEGDFDSSENSWKTQWSIFLNNVLAVTEMPQGIADNNEITNEQEQWIDACVNEYCKKLNLFEKFTAI